MKQLPYIIPFLLAWILPVQSAGQNLTPDQIEQLIAKYKEDPRGPYQDIRWFCADGSIQLPKEPCAKPGGVGHQPAA